MFLNQCHINLRQICILLLLHLAAGWSDAVAEFIQFTSSSIRNLESPTWRLCTVGVPEHILEIGRWVVQDILPSKNAEIIVYPPSAERHESVRALLTELRDQVGIAQRLSDMRGACHLVLLQVSLPAFNTAMMNDIATTPEQDVSLAHLGRSCDQRLRGCRFFHQLWTKITGGVSNCASHICYASLQTDDLGDQWLDDLDCSAMRTQSIVSPISQWQQDWFVYHNFVRGTVLDTASHHDALPYRQGIFVDVGAFHPVHLSNTFFFEHCLGWRGVCVEPNPDAEANFASYRPHCKLVQNCVWSHSRSVVMSYAKDPIEAYIQDASLDGMAASGAVRIQDNASHPSFTSHCRTLEDILTDAGLRRPATIDFMSVDTEAAEVEVFRHFPFDYFDISVIVVEVQVKNFYDLDVIFLSNGYGKVAVLGGDHVYAKLPRRPDLPNGWDEWQKTLSKDFYTHAKPKTSLLQQDRGWDSDAL